MKLEEFPDDPACVGTFRIVKRKVAIAPAPRVSLIEGRRIQVVHVINLDLF
jgi:hypothetical protein